MADVFGPADRAPGGGVCLVCGSDACDNPDHLPVDERARGNGTGDHGPFTQGNRASNGQELEFLTVRDLAAKVAAAGPRRWLARGIWPAGTHGVLAGDPKTQKTMCAVDLAVSVAAGVPWLGYVPIDDPGPVIMFCGEGGAAGILRRIRAVAEARGVDAEDLPLVVCPRSPHLNDDTHLAIVAQKLGEIRPKLIELDPFYLSAPGAKGSDIYSMGPLLEKVQHLAEAIGSAVMVVTHQNRKEGRGPSRMTGAGPAEWGRVLISVTVVSRHSNSETRETDVITELDTIGTEIDERRLRVRRRTWADDPDDLDSALHVDVGVTEGEAGSATADTPADNLPPAAKKLLEALQALPYATTSKKLVDWIAEKYGHGLRRETASRNLNLLKKHHLADSMGEDEFEEKLWSLAQNRVPAEAV
jgi:hypothetical protein